jgi:hypothetical protein
MILVLDMDGAELYDTKIGALPALTGPSPSRVTSSAFSTATTLFRRQQERLAL